MIQARELRIGNWVNYPFVGDSQIRTGADIDSLYEDAARPIPLTPEILEKCGFVFNPQLNAHELKDWLPFHVEKRTTLYEWYFLTTFKKDWRIGKFQYLHQLQNLYYTLTGEELTYTEK